MLRGRNLPAHFFCLIDFSGCALHGGVFSGRALRGSTRAGPVLAARPVARANAGTSDTQGLNSNHLRAGGKAAGSRTPGTAGKPTRAGHGSAGGRVVAPRPAPVGVRVGWREAISATVGGLGFELVDVERAQRGLLRIFIDRIPGRDYSLPGEFITVDDCEQVTRQLQYALEVEGLEYSRLEVSSPGLDRPLRTETDFRRFAGQAVQITLKLPFQGRKSWQGVLTPAEPAAGTGVAPPPAASDAAAAPGAWSLVFKDGKAEQVLGFKLEEVREARLVPVVDFKGRKLRSDSEDAGPAEAAPEGAAASGTDGG